MRTSSLAGNEPNTFYNLRVIYKSGYTHDFEVENFEIDGSTFTFKAAKQSNRPLLLDRDEIAGIWLIGIRQVPTIQD